MAEREGFTRALLALALRATLAALAWCKNTFLMFLSNPRRFFISSPFRHSPPRSNQRTTALPEQDRRLFRQKGVRRTRSRSGSGRADVHLWDWEW